MQDFELEFEKLNAQQKKAVEEIYGQIMVVAGPGTGKTQVIALRTVNIILKTGVNPENILITTFTEAGVVAIRNRLISFLGNEAYKVKVNTFHSFCDEVIKTFPEKFREEKLDTAIDDIEKIDIFAKILDTLLDKGELKFLTTLGDKYYFLKTIESKVSTLKQEGISIKKLGEIIAEEEKDGLEDLEAKRNNKRIKNIAKYEDDHEKYIGKLKELQLFYKYYEAALKKKGLYDFNDMVSLVAKKFEEDSSLRSYFAENLQFIMIDEFQDTNDVQQKVIDLILAGGNESLEDFVPNILVVGDDDQSIYRFQGANIENMLNFQTKYPETKFVVLEKNYRSFQNILDVSGDIIENNKERLSNKISSINKRIISQKGENEFSSELNITKNKLEEKVFIYKKVLEYLNSGIPANEIAIITRGNAEIAEIGNFLKKNNIKVSSKFDSDILKNDFILLVIKFLKFINDPYVNDEIAGEIIISNILNLDKLDIFKISRLISKKNYTLNSYKKIRIFDTITNDKILEEAEVSNIQSLKNFANEILELKTLFTEKNIISAFEIFIEKFKILEFIEKNGEVNDLQNLMTLFNYLKKSADGKRSFSLSEFLAKLSLHEKYSKTISSNVSNLDENAVQLMTAHSSKGLEFETVFITNSVTGDWDSKRKNDLLKFPLKIVGNGLQFSESENKNIEKEISREEDRRLFFVAITRAKKYLHFSMSNIDEKGKTLIKSIFINEAENHLKIIEENFSEEEANFGIKTELLPNKNLVSFKENELNVIEKFLQDYKISASDLNLFLESPKKFLYAKIFKFPSLENENMIFGTVYHRTLELFFKKFKDELKIPEKEYLINTFEVLIKKEYLTPEELERSLQRGRDGLLGYFDNYLQNFQIPLKTEYNVSRNGLHFGEVRITGKIDKIDLVQNSLVKSEDPFSMFKEEIEIIDYKTGSIKTLNSIKGSKLHDGSIKTDEGKVGRQLMFYKLIFDLDPKLHQNYKLGSLKIDYAEGQKGNYKILEVEFSDEEYEEFKTLLENVWKQIVDIEFWKEIL